MNFPTVALMLLVIAVATHSSGQMRGIDSWDNPLRVNPADEAWISKILHQLTLEEKVGQMLQIDFFGDYRTLTDPNYVFVRRVALTSGCPIHARFCA